MGDCSTYAAKEANIKWFKCPEEIKLTTIPNVIHLPQEMFAYCNAKFSDDAIMDEVKSADLVIGDGMYTCSSLIADKFSKPHVTVLMSSMTTATSLPFNVAAHPSYLPQFLSGMTDNMNFLQRAENAVWWLTNTIHFRPKFENNYSVLKEKFNITFERSLQQTLQKVDLVLFQTEAFDYPRPILPCKKHRTVLGPFYMEGGLPG